MEEITHTNKYKYLLDAYANSLSKYPANTSMPPLHLFTYPEIECVDGLTEAGIPYLVSKLSYQVAALPAWNTQSS